MSLADARKMLPGNADAFSPKDDKQDEQPAKRKSKKNKNKLMEEWPLIQTKSMLNFNPYSSNDDES